jgi:hypothetical protein
LTFVVLAAESAITIDEHRVRKFAYCTISIFQLGAS